MTICLVSCESGDLKPLSKVSRLGQSKHSFWPRHVIRCSVFRDASSSFSFNFFSLEALQRYAFGWKLLFLNEGFPNCWLLALCLIFFFSFWRGPILLCRHKRFQLKHKSPLCCLSPLFPRLKRKSNAAT